MIYETLDSQEVESSESSSICMYAPWLGLTLLCFLLSHHVERSTNAEHILAFFPTSWRASRRLFKPHFLSLLLCPLILKGWKEFPLLSIHPNIKLICLAHNELPICHLQKKDITNQTQFLKYPKLLQAWAWHVQPFIDPRINPNHKSKV